MLEIAGNPFALIGRTFIFNGWSTFVLPGLPGERHRRA